MSQRELTVIESPRYARINEGIYWAIDTTNYGGLPTSVSVVAQDTLANYADVTGTVLTGSAGISGNVINLPKFSSAVAGQFRIIVTFTNARFAPAKPAIDVIVVR